MAQIFPNGGIDPAWTTVALAIGAGCLAIDRYLGLSSGWMRYVKSEQKAAALLQRFQFEWETKRTGIADPPGVEMVKELLGIASAFIGKLKELIERETDAWILDFQKSLALLDKALRSKTGDEDEDTDVNI